MRISKELKYIGVETSYRRIENFEGIEIYFLKNMMKVNGVGSGRCDLCVGVRENDGTLLLRKPTEDESRKINKHIEENR